MTRATALELSAGMVLVASGAAYYVGWALAAIALGVVLIAGALFQSIRRRRAAF